MSKIERALRKAEEEKRKQPVALPEIDENGKPAVSVDEENLREHRVVTQSHSEHFRKIAARLKTCCEHMGASDIVFTSAVSGEGKTTTVANCALSLSQDFNQSVCLVDCDLRNPKLSHHFSTNGSVGMIDLLRGNVEIESAVQQTSVPNLSIISTRRIGIASLPLLNSERLSGIIRDLKSRFDFVLFDSPPILPVADAVVLAKHVSGLVLVIEAGRTRKKHVEQIFEQIERDKFIGFVMNYKQRRMPETYNYSKYYDYGER